MSSTTILTSLVETIHNGTRGVMLSGERYAGAIVDAVIAAYPKPEIDWASLIGEKVTFMRSGENMMGARLISADEGTLFPTRHAECVAACLPKGKRSKGFGLRAEDVLDLVKGYNGQAELTRRVQDVRARFPEVKALTQERLDALPSRSNDCTLGVFGTLHMPDGAICTDAVWLLDSYLNGEGNDIVEGVLYVRPDVGISEHGSVYGRDLLRFGGEIIDLPPTTLAQALAMTDWDHDDLLAYILGGSA